MKQGTFVFQFLAQTTITGVVKGAVLGAITSGIGTAITHFASNDLGKSSAPWVVGCIVVAASLFQTYDIFALANFNAENNKLDAYLKERDSTQAILNSSWGAKFIAICTLALALVSSAYTATKVYQHFKLDWPSAPIVGHVFSIQNTFPRWNETTKLVLMPNSFEFF